ncbi:imm11 family protein [Portibacter lacus]|uniref:Immunity protein 43 domain-containing protein n=1 Tax=Portibacter lacus TaxID=1099794 RepID=A0AA37SSX5_9BACT|nr:hypothetical protein [Portibacter lacus]GLR19748.1 hypothetical protein GCM10007940_43640 [Portibacter lacus]
MFYIINNSAEKHEVGVYPQVQTFEPQHKDNLVIYNDGWEDDNESSILLFKYELDKRAQLTDMLSCSFLQWKFRLVSERLKKLLESNMKSKELYKFFSVNLDCGEFKEKYFITYLPIVNSEVINIENSEVVATNAIGFYEQSLNVNSHREYEVAVSKYKRQRIRFRKLSLFEEKISGDCFILETIRKMVVSEKVKQELELINISGIEFIPIVEFCDVRLPSKPR